MIEKLPRYCLLLYTVHLRLPMTTRGIPESSINCVIGGFDSLRNFQKFGTK